MAVRRPRSPPGNSSSAALISAVAMVSTNPQRKAAAIMANRKKMKKTLLGGSVNRHNNAGQTISLRLRPQHQSSIGLVGFLQEGQEHETVHRVTHQQHESQAVVRGTIGGTDSPRDERSKRPGTRAKMPAHFRHAGPHTVVQWPEAEKGTWEPAVTRAKVLPSPV